MGYIFQDYKLLENMSVYDNVALSLKMMGIKNKKEIQKRVNYVLEAVKMYRYRNRPAKMLSGGEKQRIAIARSLINNTKILILDESTSALDNETAYNLESSLLSIDDLTLIVVTHKLIKNILLNYDEIIVMKDGMVIEKGSFDYLISLKGYFYSLYYLQNEDI